MKTKSKEIDTDDYRNINKQNRKFSNRPGKRKIYWIHENQPIRYSLDISSKRFLSAQCTNSPTYL